MNLHRCTNYGEVIMLITVVKSLFASKSPSIFAKPIVSTEHAMTHKPEAGNTTLDTLYFQAITRRTLRMNDVLMFNRYAGCAHLARIRDMTVLFGLLLCYDIDGLGFVFIVFVC